MEKKGMKLPKVDDVRKKARAIEGAKNVTLKEEDIEQVMILLGLAQDVWKIFMLMVLSDHTRETEVQKDTKKLCYDQK